MATGRVHYFILCDAVMPGGDKKTFYGVFNQINAVNFPALHPMCALAVEISTTEGEHQLQFYLKDAQGNDVMPPTPEFPAEAHPPMGIIDAVINLQNLQFQHAGIYTFQVHLDGELVGVRDFFVNQVSPQQVPPPETPPPSTPPPPPPPPPPSTED